MIQKTCLVRDVFKEKLVKKTLVLSLTVLLFCLPLVAQDHFGRIVGTVIDESGGLIPGAEVLAHNEATNVETAVVSSDAGG